MNISQDEVRWARETSSHLNELDDEFVPIQFPNQYDHESIQELNENTDNHVQFEPLRIWDVENSEVEDLLLRLNLN